MDANQHTTAGYATLQYRLLERLDMTAGLRHDSTTGFTDETTWRLGATLALPEIASRLRASGGTAFAAPSLFQRFGVIGNFFRGNPDLRPERSIGWEVGAETDFPAFGRAAFATTSVTYFQSRIRDLINFDAGFRTLTNIDRARIQGVELGLTLRPAAWFETTAAWTITGAFDDATGRRLPRRPEHVVSVTARIAPVPRVVIAPTLLFTGRSPEGAFASYSNEGVAFPYPRSNPAGTVVNVTGDVAGLRAGGAVPGSAQPRQQPLRAGERLRHAGQERAGRHALRVVSGTGPGVAGASVGARHLSGVRLDRQADQALAGGRDQSRLSLARRTRHRGRCGTRRSARSTGPPVALGAGVGAASPTAAARTMTNSAMVIPPGRDGVPRRTRGCAASTVRSASQSTGDAGLCGYRRLSRVSVSFAHITDVRRG